MRIALHLFLEVDHCLDICVDFAYMSPTAAIEAAHRRPRLIPKPMFHFRLDLNHRCLVLFELQELTLSVVWEEHIGGAFEHFPGPLNITLARRSSDGETVKRGAACTAHHETCIFTCRQPWAPSLLTVRCAHHYKTGALSRTRIAPTTLASFNLSMQIKQPHDTNAMLEDSLFENHHLPPHPDDGKHIPRSRSP